METVTANRIYEGMFLVDSALAGADWNRVISAIERIFERAGAEVISLKKWDERRLAYEIDHKDRGTYILTYFRVDGSKIQSIERDARLSDDLLRVLILNAEVMSSEDVEKETPVEKIEREKAERDKAERDKVERNKAEEAKRISRKVDESLEPAAQDVSTQGNTDEVSIQEKPESSGAESQPGEKSAAPETDVTLEDTAQAETETTPEESDQAKSEEM